MDMATVLGAPPTVIQLRCGNQTITVIETILRERAELIEVFEAGNSPCLEIY